jgi:hypothetical protein
MTLQICNVDYGISMVDQFDILMFIENFMNASPQVSQDIESVINRCSSSPKSIETP